MLKFFDSMCRLSHVKHFSFSFSSQLPILSISFLRLCLRHFPHAAKTARCFTHKATSHWQIQITRIHFQRQKVICQCGIRFYSRPVFACIIQTKQISSSARAFTPSSDYKAMSHATKRPVDLYISTSSIDHGRVYRAHTDRRFVNIFQSVWIM